MAEVVDYDEEEYFNEGSERSQAKIKVKGRGTLSCHHEWRITILNFISVRSWNSAYG